MCSKYHIPVYRQWKSVGLETHDTIIDHPLLSHLLPVLQAIQQGQQGAHDGRVHVVLLRVTSGRQRVQLVKKDHRRLVRLRLKKPRCVIIMDSVQMRSVLGHVFLGQSAGNVKQNLPFSLTGAPNGK